MENYLKDALTHLECPVCKSYMKRKIYICIRGHSVCDVCKPKVKQCNLCRFRVTMVRNYSLESIASILAYPCPHTGCIEYIKIKDTTQHVMKCSYRSHTCKMRNENGVVCSWKGPKRCLWIHVENNHPGKYLDCNEGSYTWKPINVKHDVQLMHAFNSLFYISRKQVNNTLYWAMQYVGDAEDFNYEIRITTDQYLNRKMIFSEICQDDLKNMDEMIEKGLCVGVPVQILSTFLSSHGGLKYNISVKRS